LTFLLAFIAALVAFAIGYLVGRRRGTLLAPPSTPVPSDEVTTELAGLRSQTARLNDALAAAQADSARYRQLVVDIENNAPPPLFGPGAPDDLKLIVGIGPVLERMLHVLGVTTYRQIAHWSERDIDEFDARLPEFPGRIRRDGWVTQARELHQSKYGETLPQRGH
jgi:predicted flap endonuclease-1-like 5' DNA nuclease